MNSWAIWTARTVLVATGLAAAGGGLAGAALASTPGSTNAGNISVLGGNQVDVPVNIPADICGNAAAILGVATAGCQGGASVAGPAWPGTSGNSQGGSQTGNISVVHGTNVQVPVVIAADACGNSVGNATAKCHGGVHLPASSGLVPGARPDEGRQTGNVSAGSGNDVQIPVNVPVNACGNAVAVLGDSSAGCAGGASVGDPAGQRAVAGYRGDSSVKQPTANQLAGLGALPGVANLPALGGLNGLAGGGALLPASTLSAYQADASGSGMSSDSFAALAVGALLAGAAALKLAGGRPRPRSAKAKGVAA
jgi:ChpA-C